MHITMIFQALTIARNAFIESLRQPAMLFLILGSGVLQILIPWMTGFAMGLEESGELEGDNKLQFDIGLSTVFVFATILAAFIATATLSREIDNKTALTVVSKPIARPTIVLGKYLGVSAALLLALGTMIIFLLASVRHGVMSTAADTVDWPVVTLMVGAVLLSMILAGWTNFFYGWNFPQIATVLMLPLATVAIVVAFKFDKHWTPQELTHDFKPQVTIASLALSMAVLVLASIAIAASTRLGQVMTIVVCLGAFVASLLTNHFLGRFAFRNHAVGLINAVNSRDITRLAFDRSSDQYSLDLLRVPDSPIKPGDTVYYGVNSNGFDLVSSSYGQFTGDPTKIEDIFGPAAQTGIIVVQAEGKSVVIRNIGPETGGVKTPRPPQPGDYIFTTPTHRNWAVLAPWAALPNMHYFWLLDAVSQNQPVPPRYLVNAAGYALLQVGTFLSLAVVLFQKRDVA